MTVTTTWKVEIGAPFSKTNFTSRVRGFDITERLDLNTMATFTATVSLNNFDGAMTPGGGGTYSSTDWFAQLVQISATVTNGTNNYYPTTYVGIITDFDLYDDGETSIVTLGVTDLWSIAGRTRQLTMPAITEQSAVDFPGILATWGQFFPTFGYAAVYPSLIDLGTVNTRNVKSTVTVDNLTYADVLNQLVGPSQNGFMWPGLTDAPVDLYVYGYWIGGGMTRTPANQYGYTFSPTASVTGTALPITAMNQGWNIDDVVNTATVTSIDQPFGPLPLTSTDTAAVNKYGSRAIANGQTACLAGDASNLAGELTNRFATPSFGPLEVTITGAAIRSYCANAAYASVGRLLNLADGFVDKATLTWTGAGAASQTASTVILGKRIRATVDDWSLTLDLANWKDWHTAQYNAAGDTYDNCRYG